MGRRRVTVGESKQEPLPEVKGKKAPPRKVPSLPKAAGKGVDKGAGKGADKGVGKGAEKKAKRRNMQARAGLHISPNRCNRVLSNSWRGGKISKEANVIVAGLLQHFCAELLKQADTLSNGKAITSSELQRGIRHMGWPEQSGLLKVHIIGAALGGDDAEEHGPDQVGEDEE